MEDADDPMEIDEPLPVTPIIERKLANVAPPGQQSIVIEDDEDEDGPPAKEIIDLVEKPRSNRCINATCPGQSGQFIAAPDFCLSYFRVKKSAGHKVEICMACYWRSVEDHDKLASSLQAGELLFAVDFPIINETLQIDDSDEEEADCDQVEGIAEDNLEFVARNIEDILMETMDKLDMRSHVERERALLKNEAQRVEEDCAELTEEVRQVRATLDRIQIDLYNHFRPDIKAQKGIMILDDFSLSPTLQIRPENNLPPEALPRKSARNAPKTPELVEPPAAPPNFAVPKDLPVSLVPDRPEPKVDEIFYITKENNFLGSWIKARLQEVIPAQTCYRGQLYTKTHYRVVELKQQRERIVEGKFVAYLGPCNSRLTVGSRILSQFKETEPAPHPKRLRAVPYYAGIVGEHPVESNQFRYLIFFDIGYSQYVQHSHVNLILEAPPNVWEDMPESTRPFIRKYLESQDRPMVKLYPNQKVRVEYNGKWWLCTVKEVDCSLVQVYYDVIERCEWIYRGSMRLSPMYREEKAATTRHIGLRTPRKLGASESATVVQYKRNDDFVQQPNTAEVATRAVARKSTTKPNRVAQPAPKCVPFLPSAINAEPPNVAGPTSKIMDVARARPLTPELDGRAIRCVYFTPRDQQVTKREYRAHDCSPTCKAFITHNFVKLRGHNPLSKPLLCGWARLTVKDRGRKVIIYKAPCGRMVRNISEVHFYLRATESEMTVDLFDFNHMVRCLAEFSVECAPDPKDLSSGLEQVPIPVINGFNNDMLDFCNYSTKRVPMEGVHMNLDESFLCGCDCDDDCVDKLKCACWKLTLDGLKYQSKDIDPTSVGYIYRRLQEQVITGIYECNSRCKCHSTCLNRVAQNPMSLKLQVFKTHNRGWGIRCLNDIPQGAFICIYAGTIHTEQTANEDGKQYGDEYFAELDFIETVEKFKEDYEEEALEEDEEGSEPERRPADDEDDEDEAAPARTAYGKKRNVYMDDKEFQPGQVVREVADRRPDQGIRSRLRKRKDDDEPKVKLEPGWRPALDQVIDEMDTVTISDDDDDGREVLSFNPIARDVDERNAKYLSVRELFGPEERDNIYIMDAKNAGNIGRFLNHSCSPNVFVQNVFVDTHDLRFPWVAFFSSQFIRAGTELTWNYNYDIGSVPGRVLYCYCASLECKGRLL